MKITASSTLARALFVASTLIVPATVLLATPVAHAQANDKSHLRGSVVALNGNVLKVKSREGAVVEVTLADEWKVAGIGPAKVSDIKPGDFVGIASLPTTSGGDGALEVLIFPPAMKGTGEGSYGWDLQPNSSMTNATVATIGNAVKSTDGQNVTLIYQGKEKTIAIPAGTPIVTFAAATKADVVPGANVFIPVKKDAKGALMSGQVVVGTKGIVPPM